MKYKKIKGTPNNQPSLNLLVTHPPLISHLEGKKNKQVVVTRIPEGTDVTKRDLALQKAYNLSKNHKRFQ